MPVKVAIAFLKKAIGDADVEDMEWSICYLFW
jgi:hypothetical protein